MKAVLVSEHGPPEVMQVVDRPIPTPGPGEVLLEVEAVGVNFHDLWARLGFPGLATLPFVQGIEAAGTVAAVDPAVESGVEPGMRVIALPLTGHGAYAEWLTLPAELVFPIPEDMPMEHAAAFGVGFLTAYAALLFTGRPRSGERVLVHAAAGAVGSAAVQLARQAGAIVFGTASPGKHAFLRDLGVDHPIDYRGKDFADEVRDLTDGEGVDVILDPIGGDSFVRGLSLLRYGGRLVCYGLSEFVRRSDRLEEDAAAFWKDAAFPAAALLGGAKAVMGSHMGAPPATLHTWMDELLRSYRSGAIAPRIDQVFDLSEAPTAHRWIHDRKNRGKVLLKP